jgi:class 3 adenylate cyclase
VPVKAKTRYARNGAVHIAYQVVGDGPIDVLLVPGFISHVEHQWDDPCMAGFLDGLASFARLIVFDKRGTGLSDRVPDDQIPTLEERIEDVRVVLDAVGSSRTAVVGMSDGGPMCAMFAALQPDRVSGLVFIGGYARRLSAPDYPFGTSPDEHARFLDEIEAQWGSEPVGMNGRVPSRASDPAFVRWFSDYSRLAASPGAVLTMQKMNAEIDVRSLLPAIRVPVLVIHAARDSVIHVENARYLAANIAGARLVEIDSDDHALALDDVNADRVVAEIEHFLTGERTHVADLNRVLATVLFTDIVNSTGRAAELGDRRWAATLNEHDAAITRIVDRYQGRTIKSTGDGLLATFDGPARAVRAALAIRDETAALGISIRTGVHTGEIERRSDDIAGMAVHIAARIEAAAGPGEILVSRTVTDLVVGSGIEFEPRGDYELKGVPERWPLFAVR